MTTRRRLLAGSLSIAGTMASARFGALASAQDATPDAPCPVPDATNQDALVREWLAAWGSGDVDFFRAHTTPTSVHHSAGMHAAMDRGADLEGLLTLVDEQVVGFSERAYDVELTVVQNEWVAARWTMRGMQTGEFLGVAPTGLPVSITGITVLRTACGMIEQSWFNWDSGELLAQLGAIELPAPDPANTPATPESFIEGVCAPATPDESIAVTREYWDVVWGSELTDVAQLDGITSLYVHEHLPYGLELVGQQALVNHVRLWKSWFPNLAVAESVIFSDGVNAVTLWTFTGTPTGLDIAPPRVPEPVTWSGVDIHRTNCGRVDEVWSAYDEHKLVLAIREQAGI